MISGPDSAALPPEVELLGRRRPGLSSPQGRTAPIRPQAGTGAAGSRSGRPS
jgi:hypothetical protein